MTARKRIRQAMRRNEVEVLAHMRKYPICHIDLLGRAWLQAFDRLEAGGRIWFDRVRQRYRVRKGAGPVTQVVR